MDRRPGELRRTLELLATAGGALLSVLPFTGRLLLFLLGGGRVRRGMRDLLADAGPVPVDEGSGARPGPGHPGRVYVLAGEDSGDLHAANLVAALKELAPGVEVRGMGGDRLAAAGCRLDFPLARMNVMGVWPVLRAARTFLRVFADFLRRLDTDPPDVLVPVDYPGFNLRAARAARRRGVRVVYYIAPQVWAWAPWRLRRIARSVDRMLVILPFERRIYREGGVASSFVGHPLFEHLERECPVRGGGREVREAPRIGLLPGSRRGEVRSLLPAMLRAARRVRDACPRARFVLPYRGRALEEEIEALLGREGAGLGVEAVRDRTHEVMRNLDLAIVASGTATLELTYYRVPMVVLYRVGRLAALGQRWLLITPRIALVNVVGGGEVVPEIVGAADPSGPAAEALLGWIRDPGAREACRAALDRVRSRLLFTGVARRAAGHVLDALTRPGGGAGSLP